MFARDLYHSPRVVWGREVNILLAALATRNRPGAVDSVRTAVARSGLQYAELWSYTFEGGAPPCARCATARAQTCSCGRSLTSQFNISSTPQGRPNEQSPRARPAVHRGLLHHSF